MTIEERVTLIESMLKDMQVRLDYLTANLEEVSVQLDKALEKINHYEEKQRQKKKIVSSIVFKGRSN